MGPYYRRNADEDIRRLERAARAGDPRAQKALERAKARTKPDLMVLAQKAAAGDAQARDLAHRHYPDLRLSERVTQDPWTGNLASEIDLRRSLWTDAESFSGRAPYTLDLIRQGAIEGYLQEHGGQLKVVTRPGHPDAHGRYGEVYFRPPGRGWPPEVQALVRVRFQQHVACPLAEEEGEDWDYCEECDEDGDHLMWEEAEIQVTDRTTLDGLMQEIDNVEANLLERPL